METIGLITFWLMLIFFLWIAVASYELRIEYIEEHN